MVDGSNVIDYINFGGDPRHSKGGGALIPLTHPVLVIITLVWSCLHGHIMATHGQTYTPPPP